MIRAACMFAIRSAFVRPEQRHAIMLFELRGVGVTYLEDHITGLHGANAKKGRRYTRTCARLGRAARLPSHAILRNALDVLCFPHYLHHYLDSTISSTSFFHHPIDSSMASTADIWSLLSTVFNVCFSFFNRTVHSMKVECLVALVNTRGIPTLSCRLHTRMAPYYRQAHSTRQFYSSPGIWNKLTIEQFR